MPYKLHAPGTRKGNRYWLARGTIAGQRFEISTGKADKDEAEKEAPRLIAAALECDPAETGAPVTFGRAADAYLAYRRPSAREHKLVEKLVEILGARPLPAINHAAFVEAAELLYPKSGPASRNRCVIAPGAAILHYAADNGWCGWQRVKRFREPAPVTRALSATAARALLKAAKGDAKRLLVFLFGQGVRISDALRLTWDKVDLKAGAFRVHVSKTDQWLTLPLSRGVAKALAGARHRVGKVFPYRNRWEAYKALKPVCEAAGVPFTPHMARHTLGARLNEAGASLRTIMDALGHRNYKSSMRYQSTDIEVVRAALDRGTIGGNRRKALK